MKYKKQIEFLNKLKRNYYSLSLRQRFHIFLSVISEHPDSLSLLYNFHLLDIDLMNECIRKGITGYEITQLLLNCIEIKTLNSDELSLSLFGYIKIITPAELNDYIDEVVTMLSEQIPYNEYQDKATIIEQEMTMDEIETFTK